MIGRKTEDEVRNWCTQEPTLFKTSKSDLILEDEVTGDTWVVLYCSEDYCCKGDDMQLYDLLPETESQKIWMITRAYIVDKKQMDLIKTELSMLKSKQVLRCVYFSDNDEFTKLIEKYIGYDFLEDENDK